MSHEIRTPMSGILGFTGLLREPGLSDQLQNKYIGIIQESGNRLLDTVNDLIDISRIETGQVKVQISEINVNTQIENLFNFFMLQAVQKGLQLVYREPLPPEFAFIKTDRSKLDSILTNLIKNAIKFTKNGKIEVGCKRKGKFLEFYVSDTGVGVPEDRQVAIFNRFEHADMEDAKALQGSGLGLPISKAYVEMLGGTISLKSREGEGSTFYFTIPC
jgi:signal transduction histidine kinase